MMPELDQPTVSNYLDSHASCRLTDGLGYALQQNHRLVVQLNLQHFLWRQVFGIHIHPSPPEDPEKINDVACGTP